MSTISKAIFVSAFATVSATVVSLGIANPASAAGITVLDFENIAPYPNNNNVLIDGFYNGGTSSIGTSGTNFGVEFSANALLVCLNTLGTVCSNGSRGGLGDPNSPKGALFFLAGNQTFLNLAAGFDTGFSFVYTAINDPGTIGVYDGLNGSGNLIAALALPTTSSNCSSQFAAPFCPFVSNGVAFNGIAKSISFAGVANQIGFDDITFGSVTPGSGSGPISSVPEPTTMLGTLVALASGSFLKLKQKKRRTDEIGA